MKCLIGKTGLIKLDHKSVKKIVSIVTRGKEENGEWTVDLYPEATSGKVFRLSTNPKSPHRLKVGSFQGFLAIVSILEHIIGRRFCLLEDNRWRGGGVISYLRADHMPEMRQADRNTFSKKEQRELPKLRRRDEKFRKKNHIPLRV